MKEKWNEIWKNVPWKKWINQSITSSYTSKNICRNRPKESGKLAQKGRLVLCSKIQQRDTLPISLFSCERHFDTNLPWLFRILELMEAAWCQNAFQTTLRAFTKTSLPFVHKITPPCLSEFWELNKKFILDLLEGSLVSKCLSHEIKEIGKVSLCWIFEHNTSMPLWANSQDTYGRLLLIFLDLYVKIQE